MPQKPLENWISAQERNRSHAFFIVEWLSVFAIAWLFWSLMFFSAPGSVPPGLAATLIAGLYASSLVYGRLLRVTGCKKCASPLPLLRQEIGRRHVRDQEQCMEIEYGGEEWDQHFVHVYCRVRRTDVVTYCCRKCDQVWDESIELPGSGYKLVRRMDLKK